MLVFKQVTNQEKSFFIIIQFLLRIDQYYCRRSVLERSRYFYKCSAIWVTQKWSSICEDYQNDQDF